MAAGAWQPRRLRPDDPGAGHLRRSSIRSPTSTQILRDVPIAVVDNDLNDLSREIVDALDAQRHRLRSLCAPNTLEEARRFLDRGKVFAIVGIPPDTQRDVLKGNTVPLPVYVDATYLFMYQVDGRRHRGRDRECVSGLAGARRAHRRQPRRRGARVHVPGRYSTATDLQSGRRLCQLCRARRIRAHSAADLADGCRHADRAGLGDARRTADRQPYSAALSRI